MQGLTSEILFEKFEIIEVLKKDEHAGVYLANHIYLSKKIILKVLNTKKLPDHSIVERFKREAKILARLDHPNIIKVLDFGMSKEFFYISFEYIEGESMRNMLKTKSLSHEQKEHLMIQLLKGLDYAHKNQIIHRDIKPENIFIDKNLTLKIGDFGLALSSEDNFVTNPYSIVGTPSYMSPEQVRGAKLTPQSDLFSTGVVLFELFSGKNPFLRDNVSLTLNEIIGYDEGNLPEKLKELPQNVQEILLKLLKKKIADRVQSAEEILTSLNVSLDQPTIVVNNFNNDAKRSKLALGFIAIFILIIGGFVLSQIFSTDGNPTITNNQQEQIEDPSSLQNDSKSQIDSNSANESSEIPLTEEEKNINELNNPTQNNSQTSMAEPKSLGLGGLVVECLPWAEVFIDGERIGVTPNVSIRPINLQAGEYTLKLVHPDYPVFSQTINIAAGEVKNVRISLDATMGFVKCFVHPFGDVYINGEKRGQIPSPDFLKVKPGPVRLIIRNNDYRDIDTAFYIRAGDSLRLKFSFRKP
ncbi:MAG: serine/threonine protein kinase [Melioribacteraceae bacterium]|nr:serine/threonine protein kinase [Melioribacteraceae bacterium]